MCKATARKKAHEGGLEMEPQARHEEKSWQGHVDDESRCLRFQLQPPRAFLFPVYFFSCSSLREL
ncbi:MAG: hypothetical protein CL920_07530 [Deltaproteobacteria bacterium]|nr:hypothetical protein [Deltaproteobacteria bacterium]MBU48529.1 hypothetical protein [Deltaproteobacteria bacterium]